MVVRAALAPCNLVQVRQCCHDENSFLQPGRRQCVNGADLHAELLAYATSIFAEYRGTAEMPATKPKRLMGLVNLMSGGYIGALACTRRMPAQTTLLSWNGPLMYLWNNAS